LEEWKEEKLGMSPDALMAGQMVAQKEQCSVAAMVAMKDSSLVER